MKIVMGAFEGKFVFLMVCALCVALLSSGCALSGKGKPSQEEGVVLPPEAVDQYEAGMSALENEDYAQAAQIFSDILRRYPGSQFDLVLTYNLAAAQEGLRDCEPARQNYLTAARSARSRNARIEALSFYRLSYVYECLGQEQRVIASLLDARNRGEALPDEVRLTEIPARLAVTYARIGEIEIAEQYFREADQGIQQLIARASNQKELADQLARTLYHMGRMSLGNREHVDLPAAKEDLTTLSHLQKYLLRSVELSIRPWSDLAATNIDQAYSHIWQVAQVLKPDPGLEGALARQNLRHKQVALLTEAYRVLKQLKLAQFPDPSPPASVTRLQAQLTQHEQRMSQALVRLGVKTLPTAEAERREGLRRDGRIRATEKSPLEQRREKP